MNTEDDEFNRIEMESKVRQVMQQAVWDSATRVPEGDIRALKHRIHTLEGEVIGYKRILDAQPEQEPVAWMFQHEETGRMNYVSNDGIHNPAMFLEMNPRYALVCPLYTAPPHRKPLTDEQPVSNTDKLAQPEREPMLWVNPNLDYVSTDKKVAEKHGLYIPLYTTPPQRKEDK